MNARSVASAIAALADPTRRKIFERLKAGPQSVTALARGMPVSRPAVSQHLRALKRARLVADHAEGARRVYRIDPSGLDLLRHWLDGLWGRALEGFKEEADKE